MSHGLPSPAATAPVAVIIPALNEEAAIGPTLDGLQGRGLASIIVVDNGSSDATAAAAQSHGATVVAEPRRGYGGACLAGLAALDPAITVVVFMDADGSDDPSDLEALLSPLRAGAADMVIGSRVLGEHEAGSLAPLQKFGNWLATGLIRLLGGPRFTDLGPFRAIRRDALTRLAMRDRDFGWNIEMQLKAHRHGLRIVEVPVRYRRRRLGKSKISGTVRGTIHAGVKIIGTILKYRWQGL